MNDKRTLNREAPGPSVGPNRLLTPKQRRQRLGIGVLAAVATVFGGPPALSALMALRDSGKLEAQLTNSAGKVQNELADGEINRSLVVTIHPTTGELVDNLTGQVTAYSGENPVLNDMFIAQEEGSHLVDPQDSLVVPKSDIARNSIYAPQQK
jgi:hypothetical protein